MSDGEGNLDARSANSGSSPMEQLLELMKQQMLASEQREKQMHRLLQSSLADRSPPSQSSPNTTTSTNVSTANP